MKDLRTLLAELRPDAWRKSHPFSDAFDSAHVQLLGAPTTETRRAIANRWLADHQPCIFGKAAAKTAAVTHCFLAEDDLARGDTHIRQRIQAARGEWWREARRGASSSFMLWILSARVAEAEPDATLKAMALRVASLYLLDDIRADQAYCDDVYLEIPGRRIQLHRWKAGVHYFGAQGEQRWWQDHRLPGGMGFLTNSVGHLVKSGRLADAVEAFHESLGDTPADPELATRVRSLTDALSVAMQTIQNARGGVSGRTTWLLPRPAEVQCPAHLPAKLADRDPRQYAGYYDTDVTVASRLFEARVERSEEVTTLHLDLTYLHDDSVDNGPYATMGRGEVIFRGPTHESATAPRARRMQADVVDATELDRRLAGIES